MNRSHLPPKFPPTATHVRPKCYARNRKPTSLATVDESRRVSHVGEFWGFFLPHVGRQIFFIGFLIFFWVCLGGRETLKETSWTQERFSPVRRCSEGSATLLNTKIEDKPDLKHLQQEYHNLHRSVGSSYASASESPARSPTSSPLSPSPTPVSIITQGNIHPLNKKIITVFFFIKKG